MINFTCFIPLNEDEGTKNDYDLLLKNSTWK